MTSPIPLRSSLAIISLCCCILLVGAQHETSENEQTTALMRYLQEALGRYEIGESRIDFRGTTIDMIFPFSDLVPNGTVALRTYSDTDCLVNVDGNDYIVPEVLYDDNPFPDGTKNREVTIRYTIDPVKIQESDIWVQRSDDQFFMNFCVGIGLSTGDVSDPNSVLIAQIDTVVLLQVDLLGDFGTDLVAAPGDRSDEEADQIYYAEGFLCDENNNRVPYSVPLTQGALVRVCVKPQDDALADGVYMRRVEQFSFQRDDSVGDQLVQTAVRDGKAQGLTDLVCISGSELCHFETLLNADFYYGPGIVNGFGEAWLQFGSSPTDGRRLRIESRNLRVENGFAGAGYFDADFFVIPTEGENAFTAVAYECNQWNQPLNRSVAKVLGESIRVCVAPDELAQNFGVTINSIESWNFTRDATTQPAIEDGFQAENGLTMLMCVPGSKVCTFRTQFIPDFFGTSGVVDGFGTVVLQYASSGLTARRRLNLLPSKTHGRDLQEGLSIAGKSDVGVSTLVLYLAEVLPERCQYEHEVTEWWIQQPIEDRYMYIGIVAGTAATIAGLLCCCWCFPCLSERKEETEIKQAGGAIAVNVDLKKENHENFVSSSHKTQMESKSMSFHDNKQSDEEIGTKKRRGKKDGSSNLLLPDGSDDLCIEPGDSDVCFGDEEHPGTRQFMRLVQNVVKRDPDEQYGPEMYSAIMRKAKGANFFAANGQGRYVKTSESQLRTWVGKTFKDMKRNMKGGRSSSSRDLRASSSRDLKDSRSSKDLKRSNSSKDLKRSSSSKDLKRSNSSKDLKRSSSSKDLKRSSSTDELQRSRSTHDLKRSRSTRDMKRSSSSKNLKRSSSSNRLDGGGSSGKESRRSRSSTGRKSQRYSDDESRTHYLTSSSESTLDTSERKSSKSKSRGGSSKTLKRKNSRKSLSSID